jgi:hypothetical protein
MPQTKHMRELGCYLVWALVMLGMFPICKWYRAYKKGHPEQRLLAYL